MKLILASLISGILFGVGLSLSQMINPDKVLNFLDIAGAWDPSLIFVMLGALEVTFISFKVILKRPSPVFDHKFYLATKKEIDKPLIIGATIFGIGWGLTGYCPGPAVAGLGFGNPEAVIMVITIYLGFVVHRYLFER
ncbi:YeeE/YedE family protein [Methyloglobulus sp.]|uniref:YeeE/YedE family protein n=1 Tax=Methyloglobulus sp. TaxID=2518622 RepID=UPI0032B77019